jgi:hypothetical protein
MPDHPLFLALIENWRPLVLVGLAGDESLIDESQQRVSYSHDRRWRSPSSIAWTFRRYSGEQTIRILSALRFSELINSGTVARASQGTPKLAGPISLAGEWHDLGDGGRLTLAALCGSGGEQRLRRARETARPGANWLRGPFRKAGREFRLPAEPGFGICGGADCGRGLGPHAPRVGGTVRW